jgi:regulator of sigma E protease
MSVLLMILWFFLALGILVTFHEFGHFYIARRCGVKVIRFSVGFGKSLYTWRDSTGTEFTLAAIPLGGYVKMLDEREGDVSAHELSMAFSQKSVWQRMAIVVAGPVANFILAIVLYFILALMGSTGLAPVVGELPSGSLAATSGLQQNDEIIAVDGQTVATWSEVFSQWLFRIGDTGNIQFTVKPYPASNNPSIERTIQLPISAWLADESNPDFFNALGIVRFTPNIEPIVEQVLEDSAAEKAGIQVGDRIIEADGQGMSSWQHWVEYVRERPEVAIDLLLSREGKRIKVLLVPKSIKQSERVIGQAGVSTAVSWPEAMIRPIEYSVWGAIQKGVTQTWDRSIFILSFIKKLVFAEVSTKNLSGSFTIAQVAGDSAKAGLASYLAFLAFLSVSLGVFNLMPIPVLDGGHLLYYAVEVVKGSPVSDKIQLVGYQLGLFFVLGVMVVAHVNDLVRLFS